MKREIRGQRNCTGVRIGRRGLLRGLAMAAGSIAIATGAGCNMTATRSQPRLLQVQMADHHSLPALSVLDEVIQEYQEGHNVEIDLTLASVEEIASRLPEQMAAQDAPDLVEVDSLQPARHYLAGALMDVTDVAQALIRLSGDIPPNILQAIRLHERFWAIPFYSLGWAWYVRRDWLEDRGVRPPQTYGEALEVARTLSGRDNGLGEIWGWGVPVEDSAAGEAIIHRLILSYGGSITDESGREIVLDSPETLDALKYWATVLDESSNQTHLPPGIRSWSDQDATEAFLQGRIGITASNAGLYAHLNREERPNRESVSVMNPPSGPRRHVTGSASTHFVLPKATTRRDLSLDLVYTLLKPTPLRRFVAASQGLCVPAYSTIGKDPFWDSDPRFQIFAENVRGSPRRQMAVAEAGFPGPLTPAIAEITWQRVVLTALGPALEGRASVEWALKQAQQRALEIFDTVRRQNAPALRELEDQL